MDVSDHYRGQREELSALALRLSPEELATRVPGCPDWNVRELFAHLVGVTADATAGRMDGAGSPPWTRAQIEARVSRTVPELVEEWGEHAPAFEATLPDLGFLGWVITCDVTLHGDDVREALALPLGTSVTHAAVLDGLVERTRARAEAVAGTLHLRADLREWSLGTGEPVAVLEAPDAGELLRVVGGRRDDEAVRALPWVGDPGPWLPVLPLFRSA
jgi:uncharacterized protein (TIGR03083 family)